MHRTWIYNSKNGAGRATIFGDVTNIIRDSKVSLNAGRVAQAFGAELNSIKSQETGITYEFMPRLLCLLELNCNVMA
ncbi:hypothetical protein EUGRSUZ_F03497 [Eucalyptus grandis]|uniref:Uncharacterized protein n=2 Tax=Eucalyptus grandis TaxID=71139 RepID=A0ACC3KLH3_EUCGR|nr:hypothetical protein EUGRSUZ_F03497 [Eucalyptus grandis]